MGIIDEVEKKQKVELESRVTRAPEALELEGRDLMYRAGTLMKPPFMKVAGVASVFFYENDGGDYSFTFGTYMSMQRVPAGLAQKGTEEFNRAMLNTYGINPDGNKKKKGLIS